MRLFLDTANLEEIRRALEYGVISGVTTNPTSMAGEGVSREQRLAEICQLNIGPVSAQVVGDEYETMLAEALHLSGIDKSIVVKLPCTPKGVRVCSRLRLKGIRVNLTLCFSAAQALLAANAGAYIVSPFVARSEDIGRRWLVEDISRMYRNGHIQTKILAASMRTPEHVVSAALGGAHIATVSFALLEKLFGHPLTDSGLDQFLSDWRKRAVAG